MDLEHNPETIASELASKLAARNRHVCLLLGAGAGCAAGLPDLKGLQQKVVASLKKDARSKAESLLSNRNLENGLTRLRKMMALLEGKDRIDNLTRDEASELQSALTAAIIPALDTSQLKADAFSRLAKWASLLSHQLPVEIFTLNYDLLIETGLETHGVPFFDGFVGHLRARFRADLVELTNPSAPGALPAAFIRLWKLHGSVNWEEEESSTGRTIVRLGGPATSGSTAAIYPSEDKYDRSRRMPFVVLIDRFRRALAEPETILLVSGYSFGDQHINEHIFEAASRHPRSETVALSRTKIPDEAAEQALRLRNLTLLGAEEAIIGGRRAKWRDSTDIPGIWAKGRMLLGNFATLTEFLLGNVAAHNG